MKHSGTVVLMLAVMSIGTGIGNGRQFEGGGPIPTCYPGAQCLKRPAIGQKLFEGGGPVPTCYPGTSCGGGLQ